MKKIFTFIVPVFIILVILVGCQEEGIVENGRGTIQGTVVTFGTNLPLANVKISTNPSSNTVFTNSDGEFTLLQVPTGEYSVQAELTDYVTSFEPANVQDGLTTNIVFEMEETASQNPPPATPVLIYPEDDDNEINTQLTFVWSSSQNDDDEIVYSLELRNGATNEMQLFEEISDTTFAVSGLDLGVNYFWQVTADDLTNDPVSSVISSFATKDPTLNRFFYVRKIGNNNVIFSGTDSEGSDSEVNENEIQLTSSEVNSYRPRMDAQAGKLAFLRTVGSETHLFTMNLDGTELNQITSSIPVAGFRQDEVDFTWFLNGQRIYYPHLNRLYSVEANGTGTTLVYEAPIGTFVTEVDVNEVDNIIAIKTNDASGYNARIFLYDPVFDLEMGTVIEGQEGALGGIDYSIDGNSVLYTRDVSGFENANYRQLDSRLFIYNITTDTTQEIPTGKPMGTNDLDAKFAPNEGSIIYMNTSNDGVSQKNIYKVLLDDTENRELLFTDAFMPDWE